MDDLAFMRREELLGAPMATLTRGAETPEAKSLVEAVLAVLEDHETHQSTRQRKRTKDAQRGFERAIEAPAFRSKESQGWLGLSFAPHQKLLWSGGWLPSLCGCGGRHGGFGAH